MTLVILAAGASSRFGKQKQIEGIGPNGEFIVDYNIYDAIKTGFDEVVFIINPLYYDIFKDTIGKRLENKIKVKYAFQRIEDIPNDVVLKETRKKAWGTAHAIMSIKGIVNDSFLVINADDLYGRDAFIKASEYLSKNKEENALIAYEAKQTIPENNKVKRGVLLIENNEIKDIIESSVYLENGLIKGNSLNTNEEIDATDKYVSMNMFCLTRDTIDYFINNFKDFIESHKDNINNCEYLLPEMVMKMSKELNKKINLLYTTSKWQGMTYYEDKENVVDYVNQMILKKVYPKKL